MKKILSLTLAALMVVSMVPTAFAADVDYQNGTEVEYTGSRTTVNADGTETHNAEYTITVPALLAPGGSGTVTLQGMWPSDATVKVTAEDKVEMVNNINSADKKTLAVTFTAIELAGNNTVAVSDDETVSVADISNALFGTWSGKFNYNVDYVAGSSNTGDSGTTEPSDPDDGGTTVEPGEGETVMFYDVTYRNSDGTIRFNTNGTLRTKKNENANANNHSYTVNGQSVTVPGAPKYSGEFSADGYTYTCEEGVYTYAPEANLITFTIRDTQYQAEEGMTWGEWIESEYNTSDTFESVASNKISDGNSWYVTKMNGTYVYTDEAIEANISYTTGL